MKYALLILIALAGNAHAQHVDSLRIVQAGIETEYIGEIVFARSEGGIGRVDFAAEILAYTGPRSRYHITNWDRWAVHMTGAYTAELSGCRIVDWEHSGINTMMTVQCP